MAGRAGEFEHSARWGNLRDFDPGIASFSEPADGPGTSDNANEKSEVSFTVLRFNQLDVPRMKQSTSPEIANLSRSWTSGARRVGTLVAWPLPVILYRNFQRLWGLGRIHDSRI